MTKQTTRLLQETSLKDGEWEVRLDRPQPKKSFNNWILYELVGSLCVSNYKSIRFICEAFIWASISPYDKLKTLLLDVWLNSVDISFIVKHINSWRYTFASTSWWSISGSTHEQAWRPSRCIEHTSHGIYRENHEKYTVGTPTQFKRGMYARICYCGHTRARVTRANHLWNVFRWVLIVTTHREAFYLGYSGLLAKRGRGAVRFYSRLPQ